MPEAANASKRSPMAGPAIMSTVEIKYFSDILCVWAYISQARNATEIERLSTEGVTIPK